MKMNNDICLDVEELLQKVTRETTNLIKAECLSDPLLIGIKTGGVWVANEIRQRLSIEKPLAELNITFYRDDFSRIGIHPNVEPLHRKNRKGGHERDIRLWETARNIPRRSFGPARKRVAYSCRCCRKNLVLEPWRTC